MKVASPVLRGRGRSNASPLPGEGPFGCDSLLPAVLPDGYTLTVHGPDGYYKKFTGGKPPWRR
ncbi:DddA-like double-stranded DNA deaminase toxin [Saccharothrix lopnurensis]|uniref:DddA-like double-stranded DNA deaminase toxin n=1 Tax=Saccharothrix lopnurensis TaxID=1670621 RepID=A0ABW1PG99_9PSEU